MTSAGSQLFGCVEAGGTKFVLGIADSARRILERQRIPTEDPASTLAASVNWLAEAARRCGPVAAVGVASFGPVELDMASPLWGHVMDTPKPGWSGTDMAGPFQRTFGRPVGFDTDVNAAALAEARWGAAQGVGVSVYVTIGTGIGGGTVAAGQVIQGLGHPEMGHYRPQRHVDDRAFRGICPFHGDCLEGLASGPAILSRWGASLSGLPQKHPAHDIIAWYVAQLCVTLQAVLAPGCIVLGGGVMATPGLLDRARLACGQLGAGYFRGDPAQVIVAPTLEGNSGLLGALALAMDVVGA